MRTYVFVVGAVCALLANYDGLKSLVVPAYEVGADNYVVAPLWLLFLIVATVLSLGPRRCLRYNISGAGLAGVVVLTGIAVVASINGGSGPKLARDCFYLWFLFVVASCVGALVRPNDGSGHARSFALGFGSVYFALTAIGAVVARPDELGRFAGLQLTASIFGNSVALACFLLVGAVRRPMVRAAIVAATVGCIVLSGTRSALLLLAGFGAYVVVSRRVRMDRWVKWALALLFVLALAYGLGLFDRNIAETRIVSTDDLEGGSLGTRLTWYTTLLQTLSADAFVGGFGAGASEARTGYITHADLLRFWFDYGIVFLVIFVPWVLKVAVPERRRGMRVGLRRAVVFGILLVLTFHNMWQAPDLLFAFAVSALAMAPSPQQTIPAQGVWSRSRAPLPSDPAKRFACEPPADRCTDS